MVFFNPMAGDSKIAISVASLPSITGNVDGSADRIALQYELDKNIY
jgi:hypothetical protein